MQGKKLTQRGSKRVWLAQLVLDYGWETFRPELDVNILIRLIYIRNLHKISVF